MLKINKSIKKLHDFKLVSLPPSSCPLHASKSQIMTKGVTDFDTLLRFLPVTERTKIPLSKLQLSFSQVSLTLSDTRFYCLTVWQVTSGFWSAKDLSLTCMEIAKELLIFPYGILEAVSLGQNFEIRFEVTDLSQHFPSVVWHLTKDTVSATLIPVSKNKEKLKSELNKIELNKNSFIYGYIKNCNICIILY